VYFAMIDDTSFAKNGKIEKKGSLLFVKVFIYM